MARYTMELWEVIETGVNLFDFEYNFWDTTKKTELEQAFFEHFKFHEIGSETIPRFKDRFKAKWLESIDKYSKMFEANNRIDKETTGTTQLRWLWPFTSTYLYNSISHTLQCGYISNLITHITIVELVLRLL